jgi:phosphohistidine phosphatase
MAATVPTEVKDMDLLLWRHAQAHDPLQWQGDDMQRPLTEKGHQQAKHMAAWLDTHLPKDTLVWVSPALRTTQTAAYLKRAHQTHLSLSPQASAADVLRLAHSPDSDGCVVLVGHQPTLGAVVSQLLGMQEPFCSIKKGAVWWLRQRPADHRPGTQVLCVQNPQFVVR